MDKINIYDKIMIEIQKIWKSKKFYTNIHLKDHLQNEIHSLLKRADARDSADIIHLVCDPSC